MAKTRRLNREIVVRQAAEMADAAGSLDKITLSDLASALNIRVPSLYNHITNLEDLHNALTIYGLRLFNEQARSATGDQIGKEGLRALADGYRRFAQEHPALYPLTIRAPESSQEELINLSQDLLQFGWLLLATIGLRGDEATHAIRGFRAVLHGFVSLEAVGGYKMPLDLETSFDQLITTYLNGLATGS